MTILASPWNQNLCPGVMKFIILEEGFLFYLTVQSVFLSDVQK